MVDAQQQSSPFESQLDFEKYFAGLLDELTGMRSTIEVLKDDEGKPILDAAGLQQITVVSAPDPNGHPLCNYEGGKTIIHHIKLQMNRHNSFADLDRDEIADITANAIMQPFDNIMWNMDTFGVTDLARLETEGLSLWDSLYVYLTQLKTGEFRKIWGGILAVQYVQKSGDNMQQQQSPTGSLYSGLPGLAKR